LRVRFFECLLVIAATFVAILGAEAAFSLLGLRYVPLRLHGDLPEDIRVFAQSSKMGVVPRNPVILLGDSYAHGYGDWLLETDPNRNGPFHSAHVIQRLSGRDVVALGVSGAGSSEGMAHLPAIAYAHTKHAWYLRLPPPHVAVVYFYEGNDLNDNLTFLERRVKNPDATDVVEQIDRSIADYPSASLVPTDWWRHFPLLRFSERMARRMYVERTSDKAAQKPRSDDAANAASADPPNVVEVAGQAMELPANLQSPAMELTRPELERAVLVYERSLAFLRKLLPDTPVLVVYLPSPLSSYRLLGPEVSIQRYGTDRATRYPKERAAEYSNAICLLIRAATIGHGADFLDLRTAIRVASTHGILHGPRDFKHFNRKGMEALGQAVAERINRPLTQESCSQITN
jgi:GDSL-like Lipase/Acylhydrolase family